MIRGLCLLAFLILTPQNANAMRDLDVYGEYIAQRLSVRQEVENKDFLYALTLAEKSAPSYLIEDEEISKKCSSYKAAIQEKLKTEHDQEDQNTFISNFPTEKKEHLVLLMNILNFL